MTDNSMYIGYDQLKERALFACESAGEIMGSIEKERLPKIVAEAMETCKIILAGGQVFATLALAEAEKDSMREFQDRNPKRTAPALRPATPINTKFKGE